MMQKIFFSIVLIFSISMSAIGQSFLADSTFLKTTESGLKYNITKKGNGRMAKPGDRVWVQYTGMLLNDSVFESTHETGAKDFHLGQGQLIKAWEEGLLLLEESGTMIMLVPPELGYGEQSYKGLKPNSTLIFEISLMQIDDGKQIEPFNISGLKSKKTKDEIEYYIVKQGEGRLAIKGDNAYVHYTGFLSNGSIFDSSHKKGKPVRITVGGGQVFEGWDFAIQEMNEGSKYRFVIPADLAFGEKGYKQIIPPNETILMDIELVKLVPEIKVAKWDATSNDTLETASGLRYIIFNKGEGELVENDNLVEVHYTGYFANGTLFDSSVKRDEPIKFPIGAGIVIDGWDEGIKLMRKGARFQFLVPSKLAYGEQGAPPQIPANANLIFDIEVLNIVK